MRVALLFSGQPRTVDGITFESIKATFLSRYQVDVYAHFWRYVDLDKAVSTAADNIEKFKNQYSPKATATDRPLTESEYPPNAITSLQKNSYSMYVSMKRVYELFEATNENIAYDWIVRIRVDSVIYRCPNLTTLPRGYIYAPKWHDNPELVVNHTIIMSPEHAKRFFSIPDTFRQIDGPSDEHYVYAHLKLHNMTQFLSPLSMNIFYPTFSRDGVISANPSPPGDNNYRVM